MAAPISVKTAGAVALAAALGGLAHYFTPATSTFVLIVYGLVFLLLLDLVAIWRRGARDAALMLASLVFGLGVVEIAALMLSKDPTTIIDKGAYAGNAELGWSLAQPGVFRERRLAADGRPIIDFVATIDEKLTRKVVSPRRGPTVAFFGDSFTFGLGIPDADTLPQAFADATGRKFHVLNLAVSGYGPQQFLRDLEIGYHDALLRDDPRLFVMLTAPWHAARTSCKAAFAVGSPRYVLENGAPIHKGACPAPDAGAPALLRAVKTAIRVTAAYKYFIGAREPPIDDGDIDGYVAILARAGQIAREKYGVTTLILFLADDLTSPHYRLGPGYGNADILRRLREGGLRVIDATLDPRAYPGETLFIPGDPHPTGAANRIWAEKIKDFFVGEGLGDPRRESR